jgi:hypothetical protein
MSSRINLVLLIICILISIVKMQKWTGTYAWDDQCKSKYCCCYSGTLTVADSGSNLVFSSGTQGCSSSTSANTFANPNDYSFSTTGTRGAQIVYQLSSDSNTLTVQNNAYHYCGGSAKRTSAGKYLYPSITSLLMILVGIWIVL